MTRRLLRPCLFACQAMQIHVAARPQLLQGKTYQEGQLPRTVPSARGSCWSLELAEAPRGSPHFLSNMAKDLGTTSDFIRSWSWGLQ